MNEKLLTIVAVLPAIILGVYIYKKDSAEKEPKKLLAWLLFLGVIIAYPVVYVGNWVELMIDNAFAGFGTEMGDSIVLSDGMYYIYVFVKYTIGVALIEEGFKWLAMWLSTHKNKNFNSLFDGVVYAVFVSLGFAAFENILYCTRYGWGTAVARFVLSVPGHTFFAIIMGYYYSNWHIKEIARLKEYAYIVSGEIQTEKALFSGSGDLKNSILVPVLIHGLYDFCCTIEEFWSTVLFIILIGGLYIYCFKRVNHMSMMDGADGHMANAMLLQKYPELRKTYVKVSELEEVE